MPTVTIDPLGEKPSEKLAATIADIEAKGGSVKNIVPFQDDILVHFEQVRQPSEKRVTK